MIISAKNRAALRHKVLQHYRQHGRDLPWRHAKNAYHILIAEIMLQQTQVDRVIPKYTAFLRQFPTPKTLANAPLSSVLTAWQGLGYNRRALALKKTAQAITHNYQGKLPTAEAELQKLPGIGPYTAAALAAFAFNQPAVLIETNIRSVFIHEFFREQEAVTDQQLRPLIEQTLDHQNPRRWYHALMDYGAMLKTKYPNPSRRSKHHVKQSQFEGSSRQIRGLIIKTLTRKSPLSEDQLLQTVNTDKQKIQRLLSQLQQEGFILRRGKVLSIP